MSSAVPAIWRARRSAGIRLIDPHHEPGERRREDQRAERAELRLVEQLPVEGEARDQQRDREADPANTPPASSTGPLNGERGPCSCGRVASQEPPSDADRLPDHVADEDAERDRRGEGVAEQRPRQCDAGVGEREQRHDHVARPRMQARTGAARWRDRRQQAPLRRARELRRRLLAEGAGQRDRPLEAPRGKAGRRSSRARPRAPRSRGRRPDSNIATHSATASRDRRAAAARSARSEGATARRTAPTATTSATTDTCCAVDDGDHQQREQVVDDRERQQEHAQSRRRAAASAAPSAPSANALSVDIAAPHRARRTCRR